MSSSGRPVDAELDELADAVLAVVFSQGSTVPAVERVRVRRGIARLGSAQREVLRTFNARWRAYPKREPLAVPGGTVSSITLRPLHPEETAAELRLNNALLGEALVKQRPTPVVVLPEPA